MYIYIYIFIITVFDNLKDNHQLDSSIIVTDVIAFDEIVGVSGKEILVLAIS